MAGKGSSPRPTDYSKYGPNYDNVFRPLDGREALEQSLQDDQRMFQADAPKPFTQDMINVVVHGTDAQFHNALEMLGLTREDLVSPSGT